MRLGPTPIGVDIGARRIRAVQFRPGRADRGPAFAASFGRPDPGAPIGPTDWARLADALDRRGFVGRLLVVAVPDDSLLSAALELPPRSAGAPLELIARGEVARGAGLQPEAVECGLWEVAPPARSAGGTHVIAVACAVDAAGSLVAGAASNGLFASALEPRALAAARAVQRLSPDTAAITLVADAGYAALCPIVVHAGRVVYTRRSPEAGSRALIEAAAGALRCEAGVAEAALHALSRRRDPGAPASHAKLESLLAGHADRAAADLKASVDYARYRYPKAAMGRVILIGGGAGVPGLADEVSRRLGLPVTPVTCRDLWPSMHAGDEAFSDPGQIVAAGLALHEEPSP